MRPHIRHDPPSWVTDRQAWREAATEVCDFLGEPDGSRRADLSAGLRKAARTQAELRARHIDYLFKLGGDRLARHPSQRGPDPTGPPVTGWPYPLSLWLDTLADVFGEGDSAWMWWEDT